MQIQSKQMNVSNSHHSAIAIRAAKNRNNWGAYAARQFVINRGVSLSLYRLACQLEAMKAIGN